MENSKEKDARESILKAAENLFSKNGYSATSVREICKMAGVNNSMLNYYFHSKEKLFINLLDKFLNIIKSAFADRKTANKILTAVRIFIKESIHISLSEPSLVKMYFVERFAPSTDAIKHKVEEIQAAHFERFCIVSNSYNTPDVCTAKKAISYCHLFGVITACIWLEKMESFLQVNNDYTDLDELVQLTINMHFKD